MRRDSIGSEYTIILFRYALDHRFLSIYASNIIIVHGRLMGDSAGAQIFVARQVGGGTSGLAARSGVESCESPRVAGASVQLEVEQATHVEADGVAAVEEDRRGAPQDGQLSARAPARAPNRFVKEFCFFWCLRCDGAFPNPEKAAAAVRDVLMEGWAGRQELRGAPVEVKNFFRSDGSGTALVQPPVFTGLVKVVRAQFSMAGRSTVFISPGFIPAPSTGWVYAQEPSNA